jgi:hypothetical protein
MVVGLDPVAECAAGSAGQGGVPGLCASAAAVTRLFRRMTVGAAQPPNRSRQSEHLRRRRRGLSPGPYCPTPPSRCAPQGLDR